jgi:hypothetical protein
MSIAEVLAFRALQQRVATLAVLTEQLLEESASQAGRLAAVEAASAECGACAARRSHDAARQRRLRHRHATEALPV